MDASPTTEFRSQLRQPRLAEMVAEVLRDRILSGRLPDGSMLPKQEELIDEFRVSKPSMREALRILETEGLITVQRGNVGGAVVHVPRAANAGYMLGLVLESRNVMLADVGAALKHIEPVCVALCAERPDRDTAVLPYLRAIHERSAEESDEIQLTQLARRFHEELVARCGNQTLIELVGALETLWSAHEQRWAAGVHAHGEFPESTIRDRSITMHASIIELIESGDADGGARVAREHLESSVFYAVSAGADMAIDASAMR